MAYQNILFPNPKLIHGLKKEHVKVTKIVSNGNIEYRISKQTNFRQRWTWPARVVLQTEINALLTFIDQVDMAKDSFNFYCPVAKQTYKARFENASFDFSVDALTTGNDALAGTIGDIVLIEVFE